MLQLPPGHQHQRILVVRHFRRRQHVAREGQRRQVFEKYIGEVVRACAKMTKMTRAKKELLYRQLQAVAKSRTARADAQFDEDGGVMKAAAAGGETEKGDNVLVVESNASGQLADRASGKPGA